MRLASSLLVRPNLIAPGSRQSGQLEALDLQHTEFWVLLTLGACACCVLAILAIQQRSMKPPGMALCLLHIGKPCHRTKRSVRAGDGIAEAARQDSLPEIAIYG